MNGASAAEPWGLRHYRLTTLLAVVLMGAGFWGIGLLKPETSIESLLARDDRTAEALRASLHDFATADDLVLLAGHQELLPAERADAHQQEMRARELVAFAGRLQEVIRTDPELNGMVSRVAFRAGDQQRQFIEKKLIPSGLFYLDEKSFQDLTGQLAPENMRSQIREMESLVSAGSPAASALASERLKDPLGLVRWLGPLAGRLRPPMKTWRNEEVFISPQATHLIMLVSGREPAGEMEFTHAFMNRMRQAVASAGPGGLSVEYTGGYPIAELAETRIRGDMQSSVQMSIAFLAVLFLLAYRSFWSFPLAFAPVALGIVMAFGLQGFLGWRLTPLSAAAGAMLAGLGIDYAIHMLSHYAQSRAAGASMAAAFSDRVLRRSLWAACLTSLMAFAAVGFSHLPALRDFAQVAALGLGLSFAAVILLLPALVRWIDRGDRTDAGLRVRWNFVPWINWLRRFRRSLSVAAVLLWLACAVWLVVEGGGSVTFEQDTRLMHPQPNPPLDLQPRLAELFEAAPDAWAIHLRAATAQELLAVDHQVQQALAGAAAQEAGIVGSVGPASFLPDPAMAEFRKQAMAALDVDRVLADFDSTVVDSLFEPGAFESYRVFLREFLTCPAGPALADLQAHPELARPVLPKLSLGAGAPAPQQALRLVYLRSRSGDLLDRGKAIAYIRNMLSPYPDAVLTGMSVIGRDLQQAAKQDLEMLALVAGLGVVVWLMGLLRSVWWAWWALVPSLFAATVLLAFMHALEINFNMINLLAIPLLLGVGVDDGIFLVSWLREAARTGEPVDTEKLAGSVHAITMTSLTTIGAFGSLAWTSTPAVSSLGQVTAIGIGACWLGTVVLLLFLLRAGPAALPVPASESSKESGKNG